MCTFETEADAKRLAPEGFCASKVPGCICLINGEDNEIPRIKRHVQDVLLPRRQCSYCIQKSVPHRMQEDSGQRINGSSSSASWCKRTGSVNANQGTHRFPARDIWSLRVILPGQDQMGRVLGKPPSSPPSPPPPPPPPSSSLGNLGRHSGQETIIRRFPKVLGLW